MLDQTDQWLVVLDAEHPEDLRAELGAYGRVTQSVSPRVPVLGQLTDRSTEDLVVTDGVLAVTKGALPPEVIEKLDPQEALWASAWAQRQPKSRPGEGLDWDAEGFESP